MLLSIKSKELFIINSNYGKIYNRLTEHLLASIYFKYIDILVSRDLNRDTQ